MVLAVIWGVAYRLSMFLGKRRFRKVVTGTSLIERLWLPLTAKRPRVVRLGPFLFSA
jgi:hypothetical protein